MAGVTHMVQRLIPWTVQAATVSVFMVSPICERRMRLCEYRSTDRLCMQIPSRHGHTRAQKNPPCLSARGKFPRGCNNFRMPLERSRHGHVGTGTGTSTSTGSNTSTCCKRCMLRKSRCRSWYPLSASTGCAHVKTIAWEVCACKSTHGTGTSAQFRDVERASRRERFDKPIFTGTARHGTARHGTARHGTGTKK
jgi:hypothetical protein